MIDILWKNFFNKEEKNTQSLLALNPLFSSLKPKELKLISSMIYRRSFAAGEFIFEPGRGIGMYIISSGKVNILYGKNAAGGGDLICRLSEGDFFGESGLVRESTSLHNVSAQAEADCSLLGFFKPGLLTLMEKNPSTASKILMKLGEVLEARLQKAGAKLAQIKQT